MKKLVVVVVRVLSAPKVEQLEDVDTLTILQKAVDGYIEIAGRRNSAVEGVSLDAWCNEEGLLRSMPPNRLVDRQPIVGDIVISAARNGETIDMDEKLVLEAMRWANEWPMAIPRGSLTRGGDA